MKKLFFTILLWFWLTLLIVAVSLAFLYAHAGFGSRYLVRLTIHDVLVFSLAGGLFCYFISRYLTKPLQMLSEAAASIADGHFDTRVDPSLRNRRAVSRPIPLAPPVTSTRVIAARGRRARTRRRRRRSGRPSRRRRCVVRSRP